MADVVLSKVARFLAADMSASMNRNAFERAVLGRVGINPTHVTVLNDVFVVPLESNYLADVRAASQLVCRAIGRANSTHTVEPSVFDFACSYPPPKFLGGSREEKPVAMTIAARITRRKRNALSIQFVTRDAEHGKSICSGQQLFMVTDELLVMPGGEEYMFPTTQGQPHPPIATAAATMLSPEAGGFTQIEDVLDGASEGKDGLQAQTPAMAPGGLFHERLRLLPTDGMPTEDDYVSRKTAERVAAGGHGSRPKVSRAPVPQPCVGVPTGGSVELVDDDE